MAEILRYVDTGSDAGGDGTTSATSSGDNTHAYQSLNAWEAAEQADLDTANNTHTVHCNRTNSGAADTIAVDVTGWTTSATDFITIIADDFPADGIFDTTKYNLALTNVNNLLIRENYVRVEKLQVVCTETGTSNSRGIYLTIVDAGGSDIRIDSCIVKGICSGTGTGRGILVEDVDATVTIFNTVVFGFLSGADTGFAGINLNQGTSVVYNCTVFNCYYGITGAGTAINCVLFNNTDDALTATLDYCATDQHAGGGTNGVDISATWDTTCFTAPEADPPDVSVQDALSPVFQTGNGATPKAVFTDDIIDITRDAVDLNWDIGAFEFVAAPVGNTGIMTTNTGYWGPTF